MRFTPMAFYISCSWDVYGQLTQQECFLLPEHAACNTVDLPCNQNTSLFVTAFDTYGILHFMQLGSDSAHCSIYMLTLYGLHTDALRTCTQSISSLSFAEFCCRGGGAHLFKQVGSPYPPLAPNIQIKIR